MTVSGRWSLEPEGSRLVLVSAVEVCVSGVLNQMEVHPVELRETQTDK